MVASNAWGALATLVELLALPGAFMAAYGGYMWYMGYRQYDENRLRTGRVFVMFGIILLVIVAIIADFLASFPAG